MTEHHMWPATTPVDLAIERVALFREQVRDEVHRHGGDAEKPVQAALLNVVFGLDALEKELLADLAAMTPPSDLGRRQVGEQTEEWLLGHVPHMERNRGPWGES